MSFYAPHAETPLVRMDDDSPSKPEITADPQDPRTSRPVVVITPELKKRAEAERHATLSANSVVTPALNDPATQGYPTDQQPNKTGYFDIKHVVGLLVEEGIECCLVQEPALNYYGSTRLIWDFVLCVPDEKFKAAEAFLRGREHEFEPFNPLPMRSNYLDQYFPRFKFSGVALFFVIMPSRACHIKCCAESLEYSAIGLPYPRLSIYVQSLIDTLNTVDLTDIVDGMNLTPEWGETHLDLNGTVDSDWGLWKSDLMAAGKVTESDIPGWCLDPPKRRDVWMKRSTTESKIRRQGVKRFPGYETKNWRIGQKDPRSRWDLLAEEETRSPPGAMRTAPGG